MKQPNPPTPFPEKEGGECNESVGARNIVRGQRVEEAKARRAKELRREMTLAERALWDRLRRNQLDGLHFRRQQVIAGFIADFYCHAAGLVVEVDGAVHEERADYDAERDRIFAGLGIAVLRVANDDVLRRMIATLQRIESECRVRVAKRPNPPAPSPAKEGGVSEAGTIRPSFSPPPVGEGSSEPNPPTRPPETDGGKNPLSPRGRGLGEGSSGASA